jgi:hypothetical protein
MGSNKLRRFIAVSAMAFFLGATSVQAQTPPQPPVIVDTDGDGVPDETDACPESDFSPTVLINGVDMGLANTDVNPAGCTFADLLNDMIALCFEDAKNHGQFVRCVSHETNYLKRAKTITGKQKGKIQSIVTKMYYSLASASN